MGDTKVMGASAFLHALLLHEVVDVNGFEALWKNLRLRYRSSK